ncbi:caspase-9-like [Thunnus albacares]|uniref:caspase-9-like n=1 Tax=Thunnus albacares TaxID=8236 RepID=UPI001CF62E29|nr:caspase-9-like [Thunnus albacares]
MAPKTIRQALANMLEDLKPEDLKKFCTRLVDRRKEPRVRRNRVEGKHFLDVAHVLVSTFTEQGALAVADEILNDIGCSNDAKYLAEDTRGLSSKPGSSGTSERERERPRPQGRTRQDSIDRYKMDAFPCGHCLIINNVEFKPQTKLSNRTGSDIDCNKLKRRFKAFNFNVEVRTNLKQEQIKDELTALSKKDHSQYDCCVVIILSHGTEASHNRFPGAVYGVNGECVPVHAIINYLDGQHCQSLRGKPKLFFIQACGGGEKDSGSPSEVEPSVGGADDQMNNIPMSSSSDSLSMSAETDFRDALPTQSDILVSYCTFPGCVPQRGSLYVETLDHILEKNAATLDLVKMLTKVKKEVPEKTAHFLRKSIYFQTQE